MNNDEPNFKHKYVMLIDDEEVDNFINEQLITSYRFSKYVYINTSSNSALEFLNNLATTSKEFPQVFPDVIFVDINMPIVDGFQFIHAFQKTLERTPKKPKLVILTSSVSTDDKEKSKALSKDIVFLNKPLTQALLDNI
ncbi:hypothetical protein CNR22_12220 [Sphingobacteriaceae bacterium]|nr:hypothetical protein CNR22_12220 [Sphingobacteriaceae bacterium]